MGSFLFPESGGNFHFLFSANLDTITGSFQNLPSGDNSGVPILVDAGPGEDGRSQAYRDDLPGLRHDREPRQRHLRALQGWGRSCRGALRPPGLLHRGGHPPVAVSQVPGDGDTQTGRGHRSLLPFRTPPLDRQLRPPLRLHLRLPHLVRNLAFRHLRSLREAKKAGLVVDLSPLLHFHLCRTHPTLLRHTNPRLWDLQILQLYSHHKRFLFWTKHWPERDGLTTLIPSHLPLSIV